MPIRLQSLSKTTQCAKIGGRRAIERRGGEGRTRERGEEEKGEERGKLGEIAP